MSDSEKKNLSFETLAAHAGIIEAGEREQGGGVLPTVKPIYSTSTYLSSSMEEMDEVFAGTLQGYVYSRYASPNTSDLERAVALLEGGQPRNAVAYGSGMAAIHASILSAGVSAGDKVVASRDLYGQTWALLNGQMRRLGVDTTFVDVTNLDETLDTIRRLRPRLVVAETVSNPLVRVAPLPSIAEAAHSVGSSLMVDNTFATPYLVRPLEHGVDIVVHSATKYLGGHGDATGGVAVAADAGVANEMRRVRKDTGGILSGHEAWLITRGIRTLPLRVHRQCENAAQIADWLSHYPSVEKVYYAGLEPRPLKKLYGTELGGAIVSFAIRGGTRDKVFAFMERLQVITPATTLGDLSTLVLYPAMSSHRSVEPEVRKALGITDGLVRLSIGIESVVDIIGDLEQSLQG